MPESFPLGVGAKLNLEVPCGGVGRERLLVNFFYAQPVGHAVEALHYCLGHHAADPEREISVALNAATAHELAGFCPFVETAYAIDHPFLEPCPDSVARLAPIPRHWDWVLDDFRRHQDLQLATFSGMRDYYAASDRHLIAARSRSVVSAPPAGYVPHSRLRFELPADARTAARRRLDGDAAEWIAVMPAGSSERALYPSLASSYAGTVALRPRWSPPSSPRCARTRPGRSTASTSGSRSSWRLSRRAACSCPRTPASASPRSPSRRPG
jgi:hypothetical protein